MDRGIRPPDGHEGEVVAPGGAVEEGLQVGPASGQEIRKGQARGAAEGCRRRWCSMTSCGNRAKARRHYRRSRPE